MSAFLTTDRLSAAAPDGAPLFSDLTFALGREIVGLVGRNGSGKSTLLHILAGAREPASGAVHRAGRIAALRQIQPSDESVAAALGVVDALARLRRLERGDGSLEDAERADWTLEQRLADSFAALALESIGLDRPVASLSGGERTRLGLAAALLDEPDVLLLDEPTNNLDAAGRAAIAGLLSTWSGGALVASHDRELLEHVDRIIQLSPVGALTFTGGWSDFAEWRDAGRERADSELDRAARALKRQGAEAQRQAERKARRDKAGRAVAAKGGMPKILLGARAERAENTGGRDNRLAERQRDTATAVLAEARARVEIVTPLRIDLPRAELPANRTVLRFDAVEYALDGGRRLGPLTFDVTGARRLLVSGANGAGKTTLLRLAMGELTPDAGTVLRAPGALAMLDQHAQALDPALDLVANLRARHPAMTAHGAHELLARFAFRNRDALRPAATLSGGERLRAALAMATGGSPAPQMLVLDEPTNHLDIEAVEMLEAALIGYDGALLVVSHDRRFRDALGFDAEIALDQPGSA